MNWRGLFFDHLGWKLFSLLIAFIVWSTYHISNIFQKRVYPIR